MPDSVPFAVTGATGGLGGRVARHLAGRGVAARLIVRDPSRAPELPGTTTAVAGYGDGEAMRRALDGAAALLLVSASEAPDRVRLHRTAVDAAVAAGVERIVYTSFLGAGPACTFTFGRDHWHTEEHIRHTGLGFTFLRNSIYSEYLPFMAGPRGRSGGGVIRGPAGQGRLGAVSRDDVGDVAAAVLLAEGEAAALHHGRTYELTGPEALTMAEAAEVISRAVGHPVSYHPETLDEAYASRASYGAPAYELEGWVTSYTAIAAGELAAVTGDVAKLAGHPAVGLEEMMRRNPASWAHLTGS